MGDKNGCRHHKFGYCKFKNKCKSRHVKQICENLSCEIQNCDLRHPKTCKFYSEYGRCKFGEWCAYKHAKKPVNNLLGSEYHKLLTKLLFTATPTRNDQLGGRLIFPCCRQIILSLHKDINQR